jgi:hypothetical protein
MRRGTKAKNVPCVPSRLEPTVLSNGTGFCGLDLTDSFVHLSSWWANFCRKEFRKRVWEAQGVGEEESNGDQEGYQPEVDVVVFGNIRGFAALFCA